MSEARGGMLAGGDGMIELATARLMGEISDEVPSRERFADRPTLEELFRKNTREIGIFLAFFGYGYRLREIGDFLGLHYSSISRIANGVRSCILPEGDMRTR